MGIYNLLVNAYNQILAPFPLPLQSLLTLALLVGVAVLFFHLIRANILFLVLLILFLPFLFPILWGLFIQLWNFIIFLLVQVGIRSPA
jgi:hypothetical protein